MSIRALVYVRSLLREGCPLNTTDRAVIWPLADSCNPKTGHAFSGQWLCDQAGVSDQAVSRALARMGGMGVLKLEHRDGKATRITFPTAAYISTAPITSDGGEHTRAPITGNTPPPSPVIPIPQAHTSSDFNSSNNLEVIARDYLCCDGTGFVYDEHTRSSSPCPLHHPRGNTWASCSTPTHAAR